VDEFQTHAVTAVKFDVAEELLWVGLDNVSDQILI
jgi:hypothetical protein